MEFYNQDEPKEEEVEEPTLDEPEEEKPAI